MATQAAARAYLTAKAGAAQIERDRGETTARQVFEQAVVYVGWRRCGISSARGVRPVIKAGRIAEAIHL